MTLVTISATYGSGGSRIAPALAERLRVPFLARPPAPDLDPVGDEERACDESGGSGPGRLLSRVTSLALAWGTPAGMELDELLPDQALRAEIEQEIHELAAGGEGVILGRGAAVILHDDERVLHVLLDGPEEARVRQAMEIEDIDREVAERRLAPRRPLPPRLHRDALRRRSEGARRVPARARLDRHRARRLRRAHRARRGRKGEVAQTARSTAASSSRASPGRRRPRSAKAAST